MGRRIVIIQGHPDRSREHFGHALTSAYEKGALEAGHEVRTIMVADVEFPLLRSAEDFYHGEPAAVIRECQRHIAWAEHLVIAYPLWMGGMPALLKGFLEQVFRPGFAMTTHDDGKSWIRHLKGKSAHVIITMGMPALVYRWFFGAHSLKSLERNILKFTGISPVRESLVGMVEGDAGRREGWLRKIYKYGRSAS